MFTVNGYEDVMAQIAESGVGRITFKVDGFWSNDPIYIRIDRSWNEWRVNVSHSSGGRDLEAVAEDFEAEMGFGYALVAAGRIAREIKEDRIDELNEAYKLYKKKIEDEAKAREAAREARLAAEAAKRDADTLVGVKSAEELLSIGMNSVTRFGSYRRAVTVVRRRGSDEVYTYFFEPTSKGRVSIKNEAGRVSRRDFVATVSGAGEIVKGPFMSVGY